MHENICTLLMVMRYRVVSHILGKFWWAVGRWVPCKWSWLSPVELRISLLAAFMLLLGSCTWRWLFPGSNLLLLGDFPLCRCLWGLLLSDLWYSYGCIHQSKTCTFLPALEATRKSSKDSPSCWVRWQKFRHSTDLWPWLFLWRFLSERHWCLDFRPF